MKIVFLEAVHNFGGSTKSTLELASRLKKLGHDVVLIDLWGANQPFIKAVSDLDLQLLIANPGKKPEILSVSSKIKTIFNKITHVPVFFKYRKKVTKILREIAPDIVSVNNFKCLTLLKKGESYRVDFFARTWFETRNLSPIKKVILRRSVSRFLTVSQATRQAIASGGLANIKDVEVLHSVIDRDFFYSLIPRASISFNKKPIRLVHCGGFIHTKGQHIAVEVARELKARGLEFKLMLIGLVYTTESSEAYYRDVLKQIDEFDLEDYVELILNESDVVNYFSTQDVLIHPSVTEGLPRVGLEALANGLPVIANPVGGITDIVLNNFTGFLCSYNNVIDYAEKIEKYVQNHALYLVHSKQGRSLIEQNYLSKNQEEMIERIYPFEESFL